MISLHLIFLVLRHSIVAQVIETKLTCRSVSDITLILLATQITPLIILNTSDRQPQVLE